MEDFIKSNAIDDINLEILDHIYSILNYRPDDKERKEHLYIIKILLNQTLITEKNINKGPNVLIDNYNIGNYYILKEKDVEVSTSFWNKDFMNKYMDKDDIELINYLQKKKVRFDMINKYLVIYNNIKLSQIQNDIEKLEGNYIIE